MILANGTLADASMPKFDDEFTGEIIHSSQYKKATMFAGKRVLVVGAGNSGCDIAVDAVHRADSVDLSVRRGYYFVLRYLSGKPADTLNQGRPLPARIKQFIDTRVLKVFTGGPMKFGFPRPDYRIYESHPIVNTLVLGHLGQGDLRIVPAPTRLDGSTVHFTDGTRALPEYFSAQFRWSVCDGDDRGQRHWWHGLRWPRGGASKGSGCR
ncbi:NAD(P)-binding domain-containing protein [Rhodoglobus vestalii]|uniref:NAD(P)-binding domain-containing protein n=1 Tax=Rhodoglobus vestalii TaxID=193384 RepID=UPI001FE29C9F|nr:NAD(P)-binding domain-containing protein [Rhodoglobus vestalii]